MAATWSISQMDDYIVGPAGPYEGDSRVIFLIHWQCTDQQTVDEETYHARVYSTQNLQPFTATAPFTPWADVTQEQALGWLHETMGSEAVLRVETAVETRLYDKMHPIIETGLPWDTAD